MVLASSNKFYHHLSLWRQIFEEILNMPSKTPLVTISIPTYNSGPFLDLCLKAIRTQSYRSIEINIIDGDSKDNTIEIARSNKIENIKNYQGALLGARYEGIKIAKGEYIL